VSEELLLQPEHPHLSRFSLQDVVIGVGFHWEQREEQVFQGSLKLVVSEDGVQVINRIPLESYLESVISSEMRADSHPELLRAHTIISRSWLMAQVEKQANIEQENAAYHTLHESKEEYIRWYDREDHRGFHVCADDHCQRYQGITRANNPEVVKAVRDTAGEVLMHDGRSVTPVSPNAAAVSANFSRIAGNPCPILTWGEWRMFRRIPGGFSPT
jgi:stage II sporulation protein D